MSRPSRGSGAALGASALRSQQHRCDYHCGEAAAVADVLELGPDVHAAIAALLEDRRGRPRPARMFDRSIPSAAATKWCCGCCSGSAAR